MSDQNGRFKSDDERLELSILHRARQLRPFNLEAVKETLSAEELPGAVSVEDEAVSKTSSMSTGIMAVIIICSASVFIVLVIFGVYRLRK